MTVKSIQNVEFLAEYEVGIPLLLRSVTSVVVAVIDDQGFVLDANDGFDYIASNIKNFPRKKSEQNVRDLFLNPTFNQLLTTKPDNNKAIIYKGIINLGVGSGIASSIKGAILRDFNKLVVFGSYDISELEQLNIAVTQLNEELAVIQRDLMKANRKLQQKEKEITKLMLTDPLSGIANRRHFDTVFSQEYERNKRYFKAEKSFCLVSADIDHFKLVNDTWGHDVGDIIIRCFAQTMQQHKRSSDFVARVGGEEFMIILPETSLDNGYLVINRIREVFKSMVYEGVDKQITASFGVAQFSEDDTPEQLIKKTDIALYQAKDTGRDKVVCYVSKSEQEN